MAPELQNCRILQLSDCTMMCILSYLDATSLFNLSRTCHYFKNIVEDPQLWRYIDARHEPNSTKKVQYVCDRIHDRTSHLLMRAESKYDGLVYQDALIGWNRLPHLKILALENQRFDGGSLSLRNFPRTLEELSLKKTYVKNGKLFFQSSFLAMRHLKVLILDECNWVDSNFFMSIAKYENLEILSIMKCMKLHLNVIPYLNVARHGCKKLKVLDCRFSTVANEILVHVHKTLVAMYFQSMSSYQLDIGRPLIRYPPMTTECQSFIAQNTIRNRSLERYKYIIGDLVEELPCSMLYQDPYTECSCGWKFKKDSTAALNEDPHSKQETHSMPVDDYIDFTPSPQRFTCRRHKKELSRLPKEIKNFFYQNQKKFYPDSSDNDSDSDDDQDCCMFGMNKSQQMIVLKVREVDEQGNLPEPEVIDISRSENQVINVDLNIDGLDPQSRNAEPEPQPSTSQASGSREFSRHPSKRKTEESSKESDRKKAKIDDEDDDSDGNSSSNIVSCPEPKVAVASTSSQNNNDSNPKSASNSRFVVVSARSRVINRANSAEDNPGPSQQRDNVENGNEAPPVAADVPVFRNREAWIRLEGIARREKDDKIKLRRLSLRGYRDVTDESLTYIRNLNLDLLDVTYTGVTREGIESFLTLNPNCRVVHPNYCVCKPRISC